MSESAVSETLFSSLRKTFGHAASAVAHAPVRSNAQAEEQTRIHRQSAIARFKASLDPIMDPSHPVVIHIPSDPIDERHRTPAPLIVSVSATSSSASRLG